jgi:chromatin remodeling complex protein RSC6
MLKKATPKNKAIESSEVVSDIGCIVKAKAAATAVHKRKRKTGNRAPSGIVKRTLISDELAAFLGKGQGIQMARTEVTRDINDYIRTNQLQDKTNGRRINSDCKLASLLKL